VYTLHSSHLGPVIVARQKLPNCFAWFSEFSTPSKTWGYLN